MKQVYCYGVISSSTMLMVEGSYPGANAYAEVVNKLQHTGGEACNGAITLARLGVQAKLDGTWLGQDKTSENTLKLLNQSGVDTSKISQKPDYAPTEELLIVDKNTRTIFANYGRMLREQSWNQADRKDIEQADLVCLDPFFGDDSLFVAEYAAGLNKTIVSVDVRHDSPILPHLSVVILAEGFLGEQYPALSTAEVLQAYQDKTQALVILTYGDKAIHFGRASEPSQQLQPFVIDPIDTTGGGDSFRAGVIYGLLNGFTDQESIRFGSAVAALVCTRCPGVINSPSVSEVEQFMAEQLATESCS